MIGASQLLVLLAAFAAPALADSILPSAAETESSLLVIGGAHGTWGGPDMNDVDIISLTSKTHKKAASTPENVSMFGSVLVDNKTIYTLGGVWHPYFWAYDIPTNKWTKMPDFPENIGGSVLVEVNKTLIALGGSNGMQRSSRQVYAYDLNDGQNGEWLPISARPHYIDFPCAVTINGVIYYFDDDALFKSEDAGLSFQQLATALFRARLSACVALSDNQIVTVGGNSYVDGALATLQSYDIKSNQWTLLPHMPKPREGVAAVALPVGDHFNILACGGAANGTAFADCMTYDTVAQVWNKKSEYALDQPRSSFGFFLTQVPSV